MPYIYWSIPYIYTIKMGDGGVPTSREDGFQTSTPSCRSPKLQRHPRVAHQTTAPWRKRWVFWGNFFKNAKKNDGRNPFSLQKPMCIYIYTIHGSGPKIG